MATYKTPGVYVEEISKFPPSVAQVETAIPAFIGYTEKAEKRNGEDLTLKPTRIKSILEYETYFGGAAQEDSISVEIVDNVVEGVVDRSIKVGAPTTPQPFLMYYSLQMYFANGGGPCYIVSVGDYTGSVNSSILKDGLDKIRKEDEPTLLLFPDATNISGTVDDFYGLYNDALTQCNELGDRFTIIDTFTEDEDYEAIETFRTKITNDRAYTKYGAAYYPYLETILDYAYDESAIIISHKSTNADADLLLKANVEKIEDSLTGLPNSLSNLFESTGAGPFDVSGLISDALFFMHDVPATGFDILNTFSTSDAKKTSFTNIISDLNDGLAQLIQWKYLLVEEADAAVATVTAEDPALAATITAAKATFIADFEGAGKIEEIASNLADLFDKYKNANTPAKEKNIVHVNTSNFLLELTSLVEYSNYTTQTGIVTIGPTNQFSAVEANMTALGTEIKNVEGVDTDNGILNGRSLANSENDDNATYNQIKAEIAALPITLPPSATMAGIYARTDANVGVWKAPANTSLNYVIKPSILISSEDQADLNVTTSGKSVNAIRSFIGKGTLVWGARTLAGNDNEWRYIPVRRFFNMVEESVNKASEQFVFESNDANTWVKIRAMIENFLNLQWKAGALAGAKPEQAYYVRVGLGQTMTSQDILEGRMIIEIGMAAVRPAEFIILRFSHKMQEA